MLAAAAAREAVRRARADPGDQIGAVAKGFEEIFYPGELEARNDQENRRHGLSLPDDTLADLRAIAQSNGLQSLLPF